MDSHEATAIAVMVESMSQVVNLDAHSVHQLLVIVEMVDDMIMLVDDSRSKTELSLLKQRAMATALVKSGNDEEVF